MRRFARDEGGQAIVLVATMMTTLLMFVGLAIDAGQLYSARRTMQEAADAAAYAGAVVLYQNAINKVDPLGTSAVETAARDAARNDAALNGFTHNVDGASVVVNLPPASGPFTGNRLYLEVLVQRQVRTALVPAQSVLTLVGVRGVAGAEPLNNDYAIMALERGSVPGALNISANGQVDITGAGVLSNSTHPSSAALSDTNDITYTCPSPCYTDVAGGAGGTGSWPNLRGNRPQEPDPFAGFPKPTIPACAQGPVTTCRYTSIPNGPSPIVLQPGVYDTEIRESGGKTVILMPGVYILKQGLTFSGSALLASASATTTPSCTSNCGVFLFNTVDGYPASTGTCDDISLSGNGATNLKAMTTGTYANFLFYQDAACSLPMDISGNGTFAGTGTIYLPNAAFVLDGNNATLTGSQIVAKQVNIQNGNISINFSTATSAQPILPRLAE